MYLQFCKSSDVMGEHIVCSSKLNDYYFIGNSSEIVEDFGPPNRLVVARISLTFMR